MSNRSLSYGVFCILAAVACGGTTSSEGGRGGNTSRGGDARSGGATVAAGGNAGGGTSSAGGSSPAAGAGGSSQVVGGSSAGGTVALGGTIGSGGTRANGGSSGVSGGVSGGDAAAAGGQGATDGSAADVNTGTGDAASTVSGPCDILAAGNAPCVAAHSTVRVLLGAYSGPLYQVRRASDGKTQDIGSVAQSGWADSAAQDTFCSGAKCTISVIYDQSGKGNHLKRSPGGAEVCKHQDQEAVADALPLTLGGHRVYGIKVVSDDSGPCTPPAGGEGTGYRLDKTTGIAIDDDAETEYMVTSGDTQAHQNSGCCFDYGNVETDDKDDGAATMEAIYFGGGAGWGRGGGSGPWVMADLENGIFSGSTNNYTGNTSVPYPYVTAVLIGRKGGTYALMAGNAQTGDLKTMYDGARPNGYTKMKKQGAIVLGTGGDNSDHGKGYFFEGAMTTGAASAAVMSQVHANIVAAGYGK
jgi:hypothetical protein